jgi:CheY-like chemotaxis protein
LSKLNQMNKSGPIVVIEDDLDDQHLLGEVFEELNLENKLVFFSDGVAAFQYLVHSKERPFLILSDINMPKLSGFELRDKVHNNEQLRLKCIPYLFFTTTSEQQMIIDAYSKSVQGFFIKPNNYDQLKRVISNIVEYWKDCQSPNVII